MRTLIIVIATIALTALGDPNLHDVAYAQSDLSAPSNVAAENTGNAGEVRVSWDAVPNAAYYRIGWVAYSDVAPIIASGGDWLEHFAFIDIENRDQTEHTITRLTPGVQYAFIMASNDGRYGTPRWPSSAGWAFLTLTEAPATHASLGSTAENVTWDAVPGATYYRIGWVVYEDVAPIIASGGHWLEHFAFIDIANRGQTEHTITRLTPGLLYAFIVAGNDGRYGTPQWPPASAWQFMTPSVVQPTGPDSDRAALIALYDATGGANWTNRTNWLSDEPLEHWYGVTTDDDGRVTQLLLRENNLNGPIPAAVGNLTGLVRLDFQGNQLSESIPGSLGNLANLEQLRLYDNQLSGSVPTWLGNLSNLQWLNLRTNGFTDGIPAELGRLSNLTYLNLGANDLTGTIPSDLGNLSNLQWLILHTNGFTDGIPPELGRLSNLTYLNLGANDLTGTIPAELSSLRGLERLDLGYNELMGTIPTWIGDLGELQQLFLTANQFTGTIPTELGNLSKLQRLSLSRNQLSESIPTSLGNLSQLERLWLYDNRLTGEIPASLANLTKLDLIRLAGNALTGCVPAALRNVETNDLDLLGLPFCGATPEREFSTGQLEALFDDIISKTERREAFSEVKESNIGYSAIEDMKKLRSEFVASRTGTDLYYALSKLSNARRDRHLRVGPVDGGLLAPDRECVSAPINVLPDLSDIHNPTFFIARLTQGRTSPKVGDVIVGVNGRSMAEYMDEFTPWIRHSTLHGLYWRMAYGMPKQIPTTPPRLYSSRLDLTLEDSSGQQYDVSLPYNYGCYSLNSRHSTAGFVEVMQRENFNVWLDRSRQVVLLQWLDFEYSLIQDIVDLMKYAEREQILDYDMIIDVSWSSGGSRGAYAMQRLVDEPFRVTFGNVRPSDLGKERVEREANRQLDTSAPSIFGLNPSGSWLIDWARTDAMEAIRRGDEYTPPVPFKLAHLPKDSDGILQPAPVHFSGEVAIINARTWGGSHLDQFMAMYVDNDLATFIGMPTGGYSNTWEGDETLRLPETGRPLAQFMWSIGHTIRPNSEVLEGNPAQPDHYIPLTRDNFQEYHQMLFDTALAALDSANLGAGH